MKQPQDTEMDCFDVLIDRKLWLQFIKERSITHQHLKLGTFFCLKDPLKLDGLLINVDDSTTQNWKLYFLIRCVFCIFDLYFFWGVGGGVGLYNARFIIDNIDHYKSILSSKIHIFQSYHTVVIPCCLCECWILQLF